MIAFTCYLSYASYIMLFSTFIIATTQKLTFLTGINTQHFSLIHTGISQICNLQLVTYDMTFFTLPFSFSPDNKYFYTHSRPIYPDKILLQQKLTILIISSTLLLGRYLVSTAVIIVLL